MVVVYSAFFVAIKLLLIQPNKLIMGKIRSKIDGDEYPYYNYATM
jgi:hypothetical protein